MGRSWWKSGSASPRRWLLQPGFAAAGLLSPPLGDAPSGSLRNSLLALRLAPEPAPAAPASLASPALSTRGDQSWPGLGSWGCGCGRAEREDALLLPPLPRRAPSGAACLDCPPPSAAPPGWHRGLRELSSLLWAASGPPPPPPLPSRPWPRRPLPAARCWAGRESLLLPPGALIVGAAAQASSIS